MVVGVAQVSVAAGQMVSLDLGTGKLTPAGVALPPHKPRLSIAEHPIVMIDEKLYTVCATCHADMRKEAGSDVKMWPGTFVREGLILRCVTCGEEAYEPRLITEQRHEEELQRLRAPKRSRLQRRKPCKGTQRCSTR